MRLLSRATSSSARVFLNPRDVSGPRFVSTAPILRQAGGNGGGSSGGPSKPPEDHEYQQQHFEKPMQDLSQSFHGISEGPFPEEVTSVLMGDLNPADVEILPDGVPYLPEIKYRRILNRAFGPGGWALIPRSRHRITEKLVEREYALFALGRFVSQALGDASYFDKSGIATATEAAKSKALMRTCKDLGIASELWDPSWVRVFKEEECERLDVQHVKTKQFSKVWRKKGTELPYPWEEIRQSSGTASRGYFKR